MHLVKDDTDQTNLMHIGFIVDMVNVKIVILNVKRFGDPYIQTI